MDGWMDGWMDGQINWSQKKTFSLDLVVCSVSRRGHQGISWWACRLLSRPYLHLYINKGERSRKAYVDVIQIDEWAEVLKKEGQKNWCYMTVESRGCEGWKRNREMR